jgi:hypothetical protein
MLNHEFNNIWNRMAGAVIGDQRLSLNEVLRTAQFRTRKCRNISMARQVSDLELTPNHSNPTNGHLAFNWVECFQPILRPLLSPTPSHPDYPSTHATFGGAGKVVIIADKSFGSLQKLFKVASHSLECLKE